MSASRTLATPLAVALLVAAAAGAPAALAASATPAPSPMPVPPGEPWLLYHWFQEGKTTKNLFLARPDGSDAVAPWVDRSGVAVSLPDERARRALGVSSARSTDGDLGDHAQGVVGWPTAFPVRRPRPLRRRGGEGRGRGRAVS